MSEPTGGTGPRARSDAKALAAFTLVSVVFVLGGLLVPWWYIGVCLAVVGAVGATLLTAPHWPEPLSRLLGRRVPIRRWLGAGAFAAVVGIVALIGARPVTVTSAAWTALLCLSCAAVARALAPSVLGGTSRCPVWLLAVTGSAAAGLLFAARELRPGPALLLAVFVALALFLWIVLPLGLYQRRREEQPTLSTPAPRVSVVIPAYNESGYIGDCIESILASSYPAERLEVVVVDDGSEDSTAAEAEAYREQGITVLRRENGGKHAAINLGLLCSTGEYVVAVDADSRVGPDAIATLASRLQAEPDLGGIGGTVRVTNDGTLARVQALEYALGIHSMRRAYSVFGAVPVLPGCLTAFRREALEEVGGFDPDTATEDFDITIQLLKHGWKTRHSSALVSTSAPTTWSGLRRQRLRWHRGGAETMWKHWDALTDSQYGYLHWIVLPVQVVSRLLIPPVSFAVLALVAFHFLDNLTGHMLALLAYFVLVTALITAVTLVMDEGDWRLLVYAPLLLVGYRHFVEYTVAAGMVQSASNRNYDW
ncbi:glycosyltransferase [Halorubrum sodomense]|uniref:Glycosyltransferase, catalytic subunit of cellulose synthase and poly-beta-1,6-N-acetylglucosamine synthase n=1 Tax=Halorubrum sodomense TaxID=35743 RepID=A0A1I6H3R6_HALSD|nr:glycosyltransferase [Halorubrum sodomense]SFR49072.1 Glycosyltransferase, catalytic subunit of cellulose synthase and poly-beta-1,6-N-acetylglucosamine synthase [Halorubrum sodomense]